MQNKSENYTCIFGGGAVRGMAYAGSIKAMEELNINIRTIAGSSVGSIVAGLLAVGYTSDEIKNILMSVNFNLFKDLNFGFGKELAFSKGNIFLEKIREVIEKKFYKDNYDKHKNKKVTFKDLDKDLVNNYLFGFSYYFQASSGTSESFMSTPSLKKRRRSIFMVMEPSAPETALWIRKKLTERRSISPPVATPSLSLKSMRFQPSSRSLGSSQWSSFTSALPEDVISTWVSTALNLAASET